VAALLKSTPNNFTKVLCLWTLQRQGKLDEAQVSAALSDPDAGVRKNGARIAAVVGKGLAALVSTLDDADARVRLEKIVALASFPEGSGGALLKLSPKLDDVYSRSALVGALAASPLESLASALAAGDRATSEDLAAAVGGRQDAALAAKLVLSVAGHPASNELKSAVLVRLSRTLRPDVVPPASPELTKALESLIRSGDAALISASLPFASRWSKDESMAKALEPVADTLLASLPDASKPDDVRIQNVIGVLSLPSARARGIEAAGKLLTPASSTDLQKGVIEALGALTDAAVAPAFLEAYPRLSAAGRDLALGQLLKRSEWAAFLLAEMEAKRLRPNDLGPSALFRLRTHPDSDVAKKAVAVLDAVMGAQNKAKNQVIESLFPVVDKPGDLAKGKALFTENCLKCHQYKGEGRAVSPDLTGMGIHGKHELLTHLIDPNRTVEANYISFNVRTKSGEVFNGIVARETKDVVVLKNNEGDKEIRRADIDVMKSTGLSLMPEGLESLGGEAIRDILSFLTSEAGNFRVVDLQTAFTASSVKGLYDPEREPDNLRLKKYGITMVEGVPFNVMDPAKSVNGNNAIVLKGGSAPDWYCKTSLPKRVEFAVGFAFSKLHVLGGIAAWGTLDANRKPAPATKVTYVYADGKSEEKVLMDAVEFSDWIKRVDVPGSKYVPNLLQGGRGQLRWFTLVPSRREKIDRIVLESYDNYLAPTFLAMTAEVGEAQAAPEKSPMCLIVGGGSSHDFEKFWKGTDAETLGAGYTSNPDEILPKLGGLQVLYLGNNQPLKDPALRKGIFDHVEAGKGLLLVHASTWYNWKDWPEYNKTLVGGGSRGHEKLQEFEVLPVEGAHPVMAGVPSFKVKDELYRFEKDEAGAEIQVLAKGKSLETGKEYPVVWVVKHAKGKIVAITLGHDGDAHNHAAYKTLLKNAAAWVQGK
jgi:putative heme-binding domain-containing protein